jgi:predicted ATP pyrophosphatase (TIGR00289 family)
MRVAVMFSGGKDSTLTLHEVSGEGHEISTLVSVVSSNPDSFMFHVPGIELTEWQAKAMLLPRKVVRTSGKKESEVDDLIAALEGIDADAIAAGAIQSRYQKDRFEHVASRVGVRFIAPLWNRDPSEILRKEVSMFKIIITGCAAEGLTEDWLGREITPGVVSELSELHEKRGVHPAGEGGEYETAVLDAPMFKQRLSVGYEKSWKGSAGKLVFKKAELVPKP